MASQSICTPIRCGVLRTPVEICEPLPATGTCPQTHNLPSCLTAAEESSLAAIHNQSFAAPILAGNRRSPDVASPKEPLPPCSPHAQSVESFLSPSRWRLPTATNAQSVSVPIRKGLAKTAPLVRAWYTQA